MHLQECKLLKEDFLKAFNFGVVLAYTHRYESVHMQVYGKR